MFFFITSLCKKFKQPFPCENPAYPEQGYHPKDTGQDRTHKNRNITGFFACVFGLNFAKESLIALPSIFRSAKALPGGMFGGGSIQEYDIYSIRSMRRNPVIADLFHRMKYMERRGSGLRKIVSETEKLPGYTEAYKPEFSSTPTDFRVILKNVNYIMCGASAHDTAHDAAHDTSVISKQNLLLEFCADPKSRDEMQAYIDVSSRSHFSKYYLKPLLSSGKLEMMFPDKPKSKNQKYTTVHSK